MMSSHTSSVKNKDETHAAELSDLRLEHENNMNGRITVINSTLK